jgi:hypothetical protein
VMARVPSALNAIPARLFVDRKAKMIRTTWE